jgi:hypothetical protein
MEYEFHPIANLFPLIEGKEFEELVADIKDHGVRDEIVCYANQIIDGRNRYRAAQAAGVEIPSWKFRALPEPKDDAFLRDLVISANIRRRHLTTEQRKEIAEELLKDNPARSDRSIAKEVGIDHKTVAAVRQETESSTNGEIPHSQERVEASGRKARGRKPGGEKKTRSKSAPKDQVQQPEPVDPSTSPPGEPIVSQQVAPQQPVVTAQLNLDLPFDAALTSVKDWFAALPTCQQNRVLAELERAHDTNEAVERSPERQAGPAQHEDTPVPTTSSVEETEDRVTRLIVRFNALPADRQKWCHRSNHLDKPEDAINHVKNNQAWSNVRDLLTALVALPAAEQDAFRAQVVVTPAAAELEQAA